MGGLDIRTGSFWPDILVRYQTLKNLDLGLYLVIWILNLRLKLDSVLFFDTPIPITERLTIRVHLMANRDQDIRMHTWYFSSHQVTIFLTRKVSSVQHLLKHIILPILYVIHLNIEFSFLSMYTCYTKRLDFVLTCVWP